MSKRTAPSPPIWSRVRERVDVPCDLCHGTDTLQVAATDVFNSGLATVVCRYCGLIFSSPRLPNEAYAAFYGGEFRDLYLEEQSVARRDPLRIKREEELAAFRFDRYRPYLDSVPSFLDVGSGLGVFPGLVRQKLSDAEVTAIEPDPGCAEFIRSKWDVEVSTEPFEDWSPAGVRFSHISMFHVLEHAFSPSRVLTKARELLAPGGRLFLEVPNIDGPWSDIGMLHPAHLYHFSPRTLALLLARIGFELDSLQVWDGGPSPVSMSAVATVTHPLANPPGLQASSAEVASIRALFERRLADAPRHVRRKARNQMIARLLGPKLAYRAQVLVRRWRGRVRGRAH